MLNLYYSDISGVDFNKCDLNNFPINRREYVNSFNDDKSRSDRIAVWLLLYYALKRAGLDDKKLTFSVSSSGKWFLSGNELEFSLSHSGNIIAVAISDTLVGVDVEKCTEKILKLEKKLTYIDLSNLDKGRKIDKLTELWTIKEAIFKSGNIKKCFSSSIKDENRANYIISVASNQTGGEFYKVDCKNLCLSIGDML